MPPALEAYSPAKPKLFATLYPLDSGDFAELRGAVEKLTLNDASVSVEVEVSQALGHGLKCGFLGLLHMEVFHQRLEEEFEQSVLLTTPQVPYLIVDTRDPEEEKRTLVTSLSQWPEEANQINPNRSGGGTLQVFEPMVVATILSPEDYLGALLEELRNRRGVEEDLVYLDDSRILLKYAIPWSEVVIDFHDVVKTKTSGYASFNFVETDPRPARLVKVDLSVNGEIVDALSFVTYPDDAPKRGRAVAQKLQKVVERQQFEVIIQAKVGMKVLARERIAPYRKDVLTKSGKTVGGGDVTRKRKLLEKQKQGKKRAKSVGKVELTQEAFSSVISRN